MVNLLIVFYSPMDYNISTPKGGVFTLKTVGEKIRIRREQLGWSTRELADKMGYAHKSAISRIENGERELSPSKTKHFAEVLGVTVAFLMDWENSSVADLTVRLQSDAGFFDLVNSLNKLSDEQQASIKQFVDMLLK